MQSSQYPDVEIHLQQLKRNFGGLFAPDREIILTRAPARLDIMGGGIDYAGATVLQYPLQHAIVATIQKRFDRRILIRSIGQPEPGFNLLTEFNLDDLFMNSQLKPVAQIRSFINANDQLKWAGYFVGAFYLLLRDGILPGNLHGATFGLTSTIPMSRNLSSSGALQIVTMLGIQRLYHIEIDNFQLLKLCQKVENEVVGVPYGTSDQCAALLGEQARLLALDFDASFQPKALTLPHGYRFIGMNTTTTPAIALQRYIDSRIGTMMGKKIIQQAINQENPELLPSGNQGFSPGKIDTETFDKIYRKLLPTKISGEVFLQQYGSHDDPWTEVDPHKQYHVRNLVTHVIKENNRASQVVKLLTEPGNDIRDNMIKIGQIMYESHDCMIRCYRLRSRHSDLIVDLVRNESHDKGFFGAKATGKGGGGTVAILTTSDTDDAIQNIAAQVQEKTGYRPSFFTGSSDGALRCQPVSTQFE